MKKMRRMIPALCMLLVSAIMLTTASYAWFTMNEAVTATGMQVQAKATGSLIIDTAPLTFQSGKASVVLTVTEGDGKLSPIHMTNTGAWQVPKDPSAVHPTYGTPGVGGLESTTASAGQHYYDNVIYIGTVGETDFTDQNITVTLTAPTSAAGNATNAYTVAIYDLGVITDSASDVAAEINNNTPIVAIVHVDKSNEGTADEPVYRNIVTFKANTIPSIKGVGDQNEYLTGHKYVLRVFVDGGLAEVDATLVENGYSTYAAATGHNGGKYDEEATYVYFDPANANNDNFYTQLTETEVKQAINGKLPTEWFTRTETKTTGDDDEEVVTVTYTPVTAAGNVNAAETYYVRNYSEANVSGYVDGETTMAAGFYVKTAEEVEINKHYISGAAPTNGSVLALEFKTTLPTESDGE